MNQGARFRQARELRGLTQESLAVRIGFSQATVASVETGIFAAKDEYVRACAEALDVSSTFFEAPPVLLPEGSLGLFRAKKKEVTALDISSARQKAAMGIEMIQRLAEGVKPPAARLPDVSDHDPEDAAQVIRNAMRLDPNGPIEHLIGAAERAGVWVIGLSGLNPKVDGFCTWAPGDRPVVVYNREKSAYRIRNTVAHEIAHLARRHEAFRGPTKEIEDDASDVGRRLLLPTESIKEDFAGGVSLASLAPLKKKWKASIAMLALTAHRTASIGDPGYRAIFRELREKGWLEVEPGDNIAVKEKPRLPYQLAERAKAYQGGTAALALDMSLPDDILGDLLKQELDPLERLLA